MVKPDPQNTALPKLSQGLAQLLKDVRTELGDLYQNRSEVSMQLKDEFYRTWDNRQDIITEYKAHVAELPKELRKRPLFKQLQSQIENCEHQIKETVTEFKAKPKVEQFSAKFEESKQKTEVRFKDLQKQLHEAQTKLEELEHEPIVQKFLRGETVLSSRKNIQWQRKIGHALFGLCVLFIFVYSGFSQTMIWTITGIFITASFSLEIARHMNPKVNQWVCRRFKNVMREAEKDRINSAIFYIVSLVTVYFLCPIEVTILSLLFLALGDPVSGVFGVYFGKSKISEHASFEGCLAGFLCCGLISAFYAGYGFETTITGFSLLFFSITAGLIGTLSEITFPKIDDNFVIPIVSAPLLWVTMLVFGVL